MSSAKTHILIGGAGGIAAASYTAVLPAFSHPIHSLTATVLITITSGILATWPDIDQPNSYISKRIESLSLLLGASTGIIPFFLTPKLTTQQALQYAVITALIGAVIAFSFTMLFLKHLRIFAGGHRYGTHSLVITSMLVLAGIIIQPHLPAATFVLLSIVWGQILHLIGDVVTPAGVPIFYPLSYRRVRVLPRSIAQHGEFIIAIAALIVILIAASNAI